MLGKRSSGTGAGFTGISCGEPVMRTMPRN